MTRLVVPVLALALVAVGLLWLGELRSPGVVVSADEVAKVMGSCYVNSESRGDICSNNCGWTNTLLYDESPTGNSLGSPRVCKDNKKCTTYGMSANPCGGG